MSVADFEDATRLRMGDDARRSTESRRADSAGGGSVSVLAVTKTLTSYPTSAGKFFACETRAILGTESEGASGAGTNLGDTFFAYLPVGAPIPASGSEVTCSRVAYRWVIDF